MPKQDLSTLVDLEEARGKREKHSYVSPRGFVPDSHTASKIAEAVLIPIYGEANIRKQMPFRIKLVGQVWIIDGKDYLPTASFGGYVHIEIAKKDARILRVTHGR